MCGPGVCGCAHIKMFKRRTVMDYRLTASGYALVIIY